jgi:hypothetical protein
MPVEFHHASARFRRGGVVLVVIVGGPGLGTVFFVEIGEAILLRVVPVAEVEEIVQMGGDPRLSGTAGADDSDEEKLLRGCLYACSCKYAACAEEFEDLYLNSPGRAVEVLREDHVGDSRL